MKCSAHVTSGDATGYEDEAENTWEPTDNLDCEDKIQDYEKKQKVTLVYILQLLSNFFIKIGIFSGWFTR